MAAQQNSHYPYARGFHPPTAKEQLGAIGKMKNLPPHLEPTDSFFEPLPRPTCEDDWLAQYNEDGQTFDEFMDECPWIVCRKVKNYTKPINLSMDDIPSKYPDGKIYLVQMGEFDGRKNHAPSMKDLVEYARAFFQLPVEVLPPLNLHIQTAQEMVTLMETDKVDDPEPGVKRMVRCSRTRFNARFDAASKRLQLNVDSALLYLRRIMPADALCLVALTMHDLFAETSDLFVAGMAAGNNRVGVFSFHRYDPTLTFSPEYWYECESVRMDRRLRKSMILERSCKLLVHEVSHILGLDHCIYFSCCMNGSGHLEEDFRQSMHLCPVDLHKMQRLCNFDVIRRYEELLKFFIIHQMLQEKNWVSRRLEYIRAKTS